MIHIQKHGSSLRPYLSHLRSCCIMNGCCAGRMKMKMKMTSPPNLSSMVRTFFTTITTNNLIHSSHTFVSEVSKQRNNEYSNNNMTLSIRYLSSSPIPEPKIPQPKKLELPSNLTFDPRSHFLNMFEPGSKRKVTDDTPLKTRTPVVADAAQQPEEDDEKEDDSWYDENDDDEDDDEGEDELFDEEGALIYPFREGVVYAKPLPERLNMEVHTLFRTPSLVGSIHLNESVFGLDPIRIDLLKRSVVYYRAKKRGRRNAVTKTISEVSGSGRKIRKQKGGGTARAGHSRPPHFRGGAKAHGPKNNTDYRNIKLNKKVRKLATRHVFSQKLKEGNLILLNHMHELPTHKTNDLARLLAAWKIGGEAGRSAIILDHYENKPENDSTILNSITKDSMPSSHAGIPTNLYIAARNIPRLTVTNSYGANVYDILKHEKLIITLSALEQIEARLKIY